MAKPESPVDAAALATLNTGQLAIWICRSIAPLLLPLLLFLLLNSLSQDWVRGYY